jgi:hypothetical protein
MIIEIKNPKILIYLLQMMYEKIDKVGSPLGIMEKISLKKESWQGT